MKLMEPLILIKPLSLLLKRCFCSCAGTAIIEPLLHFSHRKTRVTSQPGIHIRQSPILESKVALQSSVGWKGFDCLIGEGAKLCHSMTRRSLLQYHARIMLTVKLAHRFSDRVYGLIIPCSHKGTADHIITTRMRGQYISRFSVIFGGKRFWSSLKMF